MQKEQDVQLRQFNPSKFWFHPLQMAVGDYSRFCNNY